MMVDPKATSFPLRAAILISLAICAFSALALTLTRHDRTIPAGYIRAGAKVSQVGPLHCTVNTNGGRASRTCSYDFTATYTARNGREYQYHDLALDSNPVGPSINLYYNPSNPAEAVFVGGHSSKIGAPIIGGFLTLVLLIIWGAYFLKDRSVKIGSLTLGGSK
jgi:hypothetical protein